MPKKKNEIKPLKRNEYGLLEGVEYEIADNGFIDWRKMVKNDHLVPNRSRTQETDVSKLEDSDLLILLAGIKELANLRGFSSVRYKTENGNSDCVTAVCEIDFLPNFETEGRPITFSAIGDATLSNTKGFGKQFLGPVAENRAFVRCVKSFLRINVVGFEEINPQNPDNGNYSDAKEYAKSINVTAELQEVMDKKGVSWSVLLKRLTDENYEGAADLSGVEDLPKLKVYELIGRLKKL